MSTRALALVLVLSVPSLASAQIDALLTRNVQGLPGDGPSAFPAISDDGRIVAFASNATNLVAGDTNGKRDVFVRDPSGTITLVSLGLGGVPGDGDSGDYLMISGNGRVVAFGSRATNLVPGDTDNTIDVFAYDRELDTLERINVDSQENQSSYIWGTWGPSHVTWDGRHVLFTSQAADLVPGDTNDWEDVFMRDRLTGQTTRLATFASGGFLSRSERYLVFSTGVALLPGDFNGEPDVYLRDLQTGVHERISKSSQGVEGNSYSYAESISSNGRFVTFVSYANNLVQGDLNFSADSFVRDRLHGTTERISVSSQEIQGSGDSFRPLITDDGRYVYFRSWATNLVPGPDPNGITEDLFVRDRRLGKTARIGLLPQLDPATYSFDLTPDGSHLVFSPRSSRGGAPPYQIYLRTWPSSEPSPIH